LWAAYETAISDWERASAAERAFYAAYEFASEGWQQRRRAAELVAWRRSREAFEAWQQAADVESARAGPIAQDRQEVR